MASKSYSKEALVINNFGFKDSFSGVVRVGLRGDFHRKQLDLIALSRAYEGLLIDLSSRGGDFDFEVATEVGVPDSLQASNSLLTLDDKLAFKNHCLTAGLATLPFYSDVIQRSGVYMVKPLHGAGSVGIYRRYFQVGDVVPLGSIAEEYAEDFRSHGVGFYMHRGVVRNSVTWTRERTFPRSGGPSTICRATADHRLLKAGNDFVSSINDSRLTGIFMVEFIEVGNKLFYLECNPRPWGSMALLELSTGCFLRNLVLDYSGKEISRRTRNDGGKLLFVNPIFEPSYFVRRRGAFLSGFSGSKTETIRYIFSLVSFSSLKKAIFKVFK